MKLVHLVILSITLLSLVLTSNLNKKTHHKKFIPSQYGRNYRKPFADPSLNPLPREYHTGPISNYANITPSKYTGYNRYISNHHGYAETTAINHEHAKGRQHYRVEKRQK